MNKKTYDNDLCVPIFLKKIGFYLGVIGKLYSCECLIYIFTGKVQNVIPSIFNNTLYKF